MTQMVELPDALAVMLFAYDHQVCFDFEIEAPLLTHIHHHSLDRARERPGSIAWIVTRDRLATVAPNV